MQSLQIPRWKGKIIVCYPFTFHLNTALGIREAGSAFKANCLSQENRLKAFVTIDQNCQIAAESYELAQMKGPSITYSTKERGKDALAG